YFILTLGQNSGHYCCPSGAYDRITGISPSKCARRDLVSELHDVLAPNGIRLMVYLPAGAPEFEPVAVKEFAWTKGGRCAEFQRKWESVIREWSLRWGSKVSGWWFDGCYFNDEMYRHPDEPNFKSFAAAIRAGNPESLIGWNPGVKYPPYTVDTNEDYTAGEVNEPQEVDAPGRWVKQAQFHILTYIGKTWGQLPIRFTAAEVIGHTLSFTDYGGVVTWDVPLTYEGLINPDAFAILKEIGKAVDATRGRPDMEPQKVVRPSISFLNVPSFGETGKSCGRLCLTLKNRWDERISGEIELAVEPACFARIEGAGRIAYDLEPGVEARAELVFTLGETVSAETGGRIVLTRGDGRRLSYRLPRRERVALPRLVGLPSLAEMADAMKEVPSRMIVTEEGRGLADVKLAIADGHLAVFCRIGDQIMRQAPGVWDGSCMEIFGIAKQGEKINQLFLIPATANLPAKALRLIPAEHHSKIKIVPAPELKFESWSVAGGYNSAALIPLACWLKRPAPPDSFFFEIIVNTGVAMNSFGRASMFGNINASYQSEGYALASVI
ncbi:MAG: hypothetical protein WC637_22125, partial [Victivallales bacterium]